MNTDRDGESLSVGQPHPHLFVLSVRGSNRHWAEPVHETFTLAALQPQETPVTEWRTRNRLATAASGQLMLINAGDGHKTVRVNTRATFDVIKLSPSWLDELSRELLGRATFRFRSPVCDSAVVFRAIAAVTGALAHDTDSLSVESTCHELAYSVVTELSETPCPDRPPSGKGMDWRLRRVRDRLRDTDGTRPSLDELERESGLRKSQLCALFKKEYGIPIGEYWTGRRVAKATSSLITGVSVTDVAAQFGFSDEAHFSRIFSRYRGLPPGRWLSLYRRNSRPAFSATPPSRRGARRTPDPVL